MWNNDAHGCPVEDLTMATVLTKRPKIQTLADLLNRLGDVPLERIRFQPPPGRATEKDVIAAMESAEKHICELVDGVLVEKAMGYYESRLAVALIHFLESFLDRHDLGIVLGADGTIRLARGLVRIPDVSFFSWDHFPNRELPPEPIPDLFPDLAVEVLSESNTRKEMERKLGEYFSAGARLVWLVQPKTRSVDVYTSPTDVRKVRNGQTLDGGEVLPGFTLPVRQLFTRAGRQRKGR
jgi:Uma2 family endonuclease